MKRVFLLTGSNLGDSFSFLKRAETEIGREIGHIINQSHIYKSQSWGYESSGIYYNQCIEIETEFEPHSILTKLLNIEANMGRIRVGDSYSDREIDIDILFYGEEIIEDELLVIPHPRMHLRNFVLMPISEIAGEFVHPVLRKTLTELLHLCSDKSIVSMVQ